MCKPKPTIEQIIDILHKELSVKNPTYQNIRIDGKTEAAKKIKELFECGCETVKTNNIID